MVIENASTNEAERLFLRALGWLGETYADRVFYVERDLVYTVQTRLNKLIDIENESWWVYNDYPMIPGSRRHLSADLALLDPRGRVAVAVEFKYEPCHRRHDVLRNKLPVTVWADTVKDTARVKEFVERGRAVVAYAICIDEGGYLSRRGCPLTPTSEHGTQALATITL